MRIYFSFALSLLLSHPAYSADIIQTLTGTGTAGYSGDNSLAAAARLNQPLGVTRSGSQIFIADTNNHVIRKIGVDGFISTFAGTGVAGNNADLTQPAEFNLPSAVAMDTASNLYIADSNNNRLQVIDALGTRTTIWGNATIQGYSGDGGHAANALFNFPLALTVAADNSVYIADSRNHVVRKVNPQGLIDTVLGNGFAGMGTLNQDARNVPLNTPAGLALDASGNLYVADQFNHRVIKVDTANLATLYAGNGTVGYGGDGGPANAASLSSPYGLSIDGSGSLYISDANNHVIRKVDPQGTISTVAGSGIAGYSGNGGDALTAKLNTPAGLSVDSTGNITVVDRYNHSIRVIDATGNSGTIGSYALTIGKLGNGIGTVSGPPGIDGAALSCGLSCTQTYPSGQTVNLTATPATGMKFFGWSGDCAGVNAVVQISMNRARSCQAHFEATDTFEFTQPTYTIREDGAALTVTVKRVSLSPDAAVNVAFNFQDGSAYQQLGDYSGENSRLYWAAGLSGERSIYVSINDNPHINNDRYFDIVLADPQGGAVLGVNQQTRITIINDDIATSSTPCTGTLIDKSCGAIGVTLGTLTVTSQAHLSGGIIAGTVTNNGWVSNVRILPKGVLRGGILVGDIISEGHIDSVHFYGALLSGGWLDGTNYGNAGIMENIRLQAGATVDGGTLRGYISGTPGLPGVLRNVSLASGSYLANIALGVGTAINPANIAIGPGVSGLSTIPPLPAAAHNPCPSRVSLPPLFDASLAQLKSGESLINSLNTVQPFTDPLWRFNLSSTQGAIQISRPDFQVAIYPLMFNTETSDIDWTIAARHQVNFFLGARKLVTRPALQSPCRMAEALNMPLRIEPDGFVRVIVDSDHDVVFWPDLVALTVAANVSDEFLVQNIAELPGFSRISHVFNDPQGFRRQQPLHPGPADLASLQRFVSQLQVDDSRDIYSFSLGNRRYRGVFDFMVTKLRVPVPNAVRIQDIPDRNGDGINDYLVNFPARQQQVLFAVP